MKAPDYTKGNWKYTANTHNKVSPFFIQSGPHIIADMMPTLQNNTEANAQLIAAAPELAEAANKAIVGIKYVKANIGDAHGHLSETIQILKAALIKAGYTL